MNYRSGVSDSSIASNQSNLRRSDVYFEDYSPAPDTHDVDDSESIISPSRPTNSFNLWNIASGLSSGHIPNRRFIDRSGEFKQSAGKLALRKKIDKKRWRAIYGTDWFHSLVNSPTWRIILTLMTAYVTIVAMFAIPYHFIGTQKGDVCNLGLKNFHEAFNFSLETMATIGYGTKDIFFGDCVSMTIVLTLQVCLRIVMDALTIGVIYSRLARPTTRATTIIVSSNAVIRRIQGKLYLMFQVCELRKHQLVEAHVRMYSLKTESDMYTNINRPSEFPDTYTSGAKYFQSCPMRINQPSDERGAMLLLCLPQIVVHEIDESSPLRPPCQWRANSNGQIYKIDDSFSVSHANNKPNGGGVSSIQKNNRSVFHTPTRSISSDATMTPIASEKAPLVSNIEMASNKKSDYTFIDELQSDLKSDDYGNESASQRTERMMIQAYMEDRRIEVVVIIEGSDQATGGIVQARHSFISSEVKWHQTFAPCVFEDSIDGSIVIDFNMFHKLRPASVDAPTPGAVASFVA